MTNFPLFLFFLFIMPFCKAQDNVPNSLKTYTFDEIKKKQYRAQNKNDFNLAKIYAKFYVEKAKLEKDTLQIAKGYKLFTFITDPKVAISYTDSVINLTKNKTYKDYPSEGYILKG